MNLKDIKLKYNDSKVRYNQNRSNVRGWYHWSDLNQEFNKEMILLENGVDQTVNARMGHMI